MRRTGVLLVNLGTPDSPSTRDVRRYLRQFLSDPLVIDIPALPRWLLLNLVILPFRPRKSAAAYAQIWTDAGSPLRIHGERLRDAVAATLGERFHVELAMRYGEPSIASAVERTRAVGVDRWVVARYPDHRDDIPVSGYIKGTDLLTRRAAVVEVKVGDGRVVLIGFRAQHRAQPHRTFKLLFNSLYLPGLTETTLGEEG